MAKVIDKPKTLEQRIKDALSVGLKSAGIKARIEFEAIRGTKLRRVVVLSKQFENLRPSERQDLVWRMMSQELTPNEQLQISMILTLAPRELEGH